MTINFDRVISILGSVEIEGEYGPKQGDYLPIADGARIPAWVEDMLPGKSEVARQGIKIAANPVRVRVRYRTDIKATMRVVVHGDRDKTMEIIAGPAEMGRREYIELVCVEYSS